LAGQVSLERYGAVIPISSIPGAGFSEKNVIQQCHCDGASTDAKVSHFHDFECSYGVVADASVCDTAGFHP
jgi:hypothetical protein